MYKLVKQKIAHNFVNHNFNVISNLSVNYYFEIRVSLNISVSPNFI